MRPRCTEDKRLLFLKKKKQKDFFPLRPPAPRLPRRKARRFFIAPASSWAAGEGPTPSRHTPSPDPGRTTVNPAATPGKMRNLFPCHPRPSSINVILNDHPTRRTERSRRTAPLGAGDPARPHSGVPQAPAAGPAGRPLDGGHHRPHAARPAQGLALLHQHPPERRPGLRPGRVCPAPHSPIARRTRLAHARPPQPRHGPVRQARARNPPAPERPRAPLAAARPNSPRIRRRNPACGGADSRPVPTVPSDGLPL